MFSISFFRLMIRTSILLFFPIVLFSCSVDKKLAEYSGKIIMESDLKSMVNLFFGDYSRLNKDQKKKILKDMALIHILYEKSDKKKENIQDLEYTKIKVLSDLALQNWQKREENQKEVFVPLYHILFAPDEATRKKGIDQKKAQTLSEKYKTDAFSLVEKIVLKEISWEEAVKKSLDKESSSKNGSLGYIAQNTRFPAKSFPQISLILMYSANPDHYRDFKFCRAKEKVPLVNHDIIGKDKLVLCKKSGKNKYEILYSADQKSIGNPKDFKIEKISIKGIYPPLRTFYGWHIFKSEQPLMMNKQEYHRFIKNNSEKINIKSIENNANYVWDKILSRRLKKFLDKEYAANGIFVDYLLPCDWRSREEIIKKSNFLIRKNQYERFLRWVYERYPGQFTLSCESEQNLFNKYLKNFILSKYARSNQLDRNEEYLKRIQWEEKSEISQRYINKHWLKEVIIEEKDVIKEKNNLKALYKATSFNNEDIRKRLLLIKKKQVIHLKKEALLKENNFRLIDENL